MTETDFDRLLANLMAATAETAEEQRRIIAACDNALLSSDINIQSHIRAMIDNHSVRHEDTLKLLQDFATRFGRREPVPIETAPPSTAIPQYNPTYQEPEPEYEDEWDEIPEAIRYRGEHDRTT